MAVNPNIESDEPCPPGLLWSYSLDGHGAGTAQASEQGSLQAPLEGFRWVHLRCDAGGLDSWLISQGLDDALVEALTATETRPRTTPMVNGTLVVLRGINKNPDADLEDMVSLRLWFNDNIVISARKSERKLLSVEDVRKSIENRTGPKTTAEFVVAVITRLADHISDAVDGIDEELTHIETHMDDIASHEGRPKLALLRRQTASLRRYLAPQRDALDALYRTQGVLENDDASALREQTDRTTRYVEDLDLARERTLVQQEEIRNRVAEQQNVRMYVLSLVTAIFLPLSFLTGIFGMNVAGLPGTEDAMAFIYLALSMIILAAGITAIMRLSKWF